MKQLFIVLASIAFCTFQSCKSSGQEAAKHSPEGHKASQAQEENTFKTYNQLDSADKLVFNRMMEIHDSIMPKLSEIKRMQNLINPIFKEQKKKQITGDAMTDDMRAAMSDLNRGENSMWEWMHDLDEHFDLVPAAEKKAFIRSSYARLLGVQSTMAEGISVGKMVIKKYKLDDAKK
ncbi:MAG: hypothetical protein ABIV51_01435 [Saprospiraceae bacterium]